MEITKKEKEKVENWIKENRAKEPLPLIPDYLAVLCAKSLKASICKGDFNYYLDVFSTVCSRLMEYSNEHKVDSITYEEFVELFQNNELPSSEEEKGPADYYFALNQFRVCAFMLYLHHELDFDAFDDFAMKELNAIEKETKGEA